MTVAATGTHKLLRANGDRRTVHLVHVDAEWHRPEQPTGGMGGHPELDALCGARGMPLWQDTTDLPMCQECRRLL